MTQARGAGTSLAKYVHKVQQCTFCNVTQWLQLIQKTMTGLQQVEAFIYLDKKMPVPRLGQPWIVNLLKLQQGPTTIRSMKLKVFCNMDDASNGHSDYRKEVKDFMRGVQKELRRAATNRKRMAKELGASKLKELTNNAVEETTEVTPEGEAELVGPISEMETG